ncbi:Flp pilus assembly complex ATPase component TadA [bacterium]|nr:Flp pilus assembly complex ATPase component TadA [bacterium]
MVDISEDQSKKKKYRLGEMLVSAGIITHEQLEVALKEQNKTRDQLGRLLVKLNFATEEVIASFIASQLGISFVSLAEIGFSEIDPKVAKSIPDNIIQRQKLIPIAREGNILTVAMANPLNIIAIDDIGIITGYEVKPVIATESEINAVIEKYYGTELMRNVVKDTEARKVEIVEVEDIGKTIMEGGGAPVVTLVNHILIEAIKNNASDIHIEPFEKTLRVRYRIDGLLHEAITPPKQLQNALIYRIKIMSHLDIAERRLPQDGRTKVRLHDRDIDLRISILPTTFGEKAVMRILDSSALAMDITSLGLEPDAFPVYRKNVQVPYGFILVTGPTGSGKTTTLYSTLKLINTIGKNVITIEDPVEYVLPGINQVQVRPDIGLNFANGLRSFLRQDPDIIMVGEIRDKETAEVAINAALTGHLVFSTLHTNDASGAVTRLLNMGVEPFLISSTVVMCVAQRLIRVICPNCKEPYPPDEGTLAELGKKWKDLETLYRGKGCKNCAKIGYKGRVAIFEVLEIDEAIKEMIARRATASEVKNCARQKGMITLREAAIRKVATGLTTIEELRRITAEEAIL